MARQIGFLFVALVLVSSYSLAHGGVIDDIGQGINKAYDSAANLACVLSHKSEFDQCYKDVKPAYQNLDYSNVKEDDQKDACCSYLAYRDCVQTVAYKHCGDKAAESAQSVLNTLKGASGTCDKYNSIIDCMDPVVLIAVLIILAIVAIAILGCLIRICQSCCAC